VLSPHRRRHAMHGTAATIELLERQVEERNRKTI
jgi:hypothetical protein